MSFKNEKGDSVSFMVFKAGPELDLFRGAKNYICSVLLGDARAIMKVVKRCYYSLVREKGMLQ